MYHKFQSTGSFGGRQHTFALLAGSGESFGPSDVYASKSYRKYTPPRVHKKCTPRNLFFLWQIFLFLFVGFFFSLNLLKRILTYSQAKSEQKNCLFYNFQKTIVLGWHHPPKPPGLWGLGLTPPPQTPDAFGLNPPSQLVIEYHLLAFLIWFAIISQVTL